MTEKRNPLQRGFRRLRDHKWIALTVVWGLVITVLAFVTPSETVREQTPSVHALSDLDSAMGDAVGLLSEEPYGYAVTPLAGGETCDITPVRGGEQYSRSLRVFAEPEELKKVGKKLGEGLAKRYGLVRTSLDGKPLAYQGERQSFARFSLVTTDHEVTWRAETGCRPEGDEIGVIEPRFDVPDALSAALSGLAVKTADWSRAEVSCGDLGGPGGTAQTISASGRLPEGSKLDDVSDVFGDDATLVVANDSVLAYREGSTNWSVSLRGATVMVAATSDCETD